MLVAPTPRLTPRLLMRLHMQTSGSNDGKGLHYKRIKKFLALSFGKSPAMHIMTTIKHLKITSHFLYVY